MASYESHYGTSHASEAFGVVMLLAVLATAALDIYAFFHVF
jgi:hypothetical protein